MADIFLINIQKDPQLFYMEVELTLTCLFDQSINNCYDKSLERACLLTTIVPILEVILFFH